ncbi:hypothetical protein BaRGS_00015047 [Batillaria attramentaria]|uniref:Hedgehog N-terminal signalling domain-containing protein n=1 Tax=Batillaria attramentaria TaxID=370345 RepID=A0ABD0L2H6_9CAEN
MARGGWCSLVGVIALLVSPSLGLSSKDKRFKHDVDTTEEESGEKFQLHSEGMLAEIIDLDSMPEVKRVACAGDRLMLLMNDTTPAHDWKIDQVVLGGPQWGCNVTRHDPKPKDIYVKIVSMFFPLDGQVTIHHAQAGPFDMLEEANIHFHYEPGKKAHRLHSFAKEEKRHRYRRALSNLVSDILNNIDWHANFTADIPFDVGLSDNATDESGNATESERVLALHKSWGQQGLTVTRGRDVKKTTDDFVFFLEKLNGDSRLSYTFDLVIKNIEGKPQIVRYVNQFDVESNIEADAAMHFKREIGLMYNTTLFNTPSTEVFRIPVIKAKPDIPAVFLSVSYDAQTFADVQAYSAGKSSLRTSFNGSGFVTVSQQYDPITNKQSDVSSREWSIGPEEQSLRSPYAARVDFSIYQKMRFTSAISWHYHDVDIELSPPVELTVKPDVKLRSSSPGLSRCVESSISVNSHVHAARAHFTADAFGLKIWDVALQPAMTKDIYLINSSLGQGCDARCHGASVLNSDLFNSTHSTAAPTGLTTFSGNQAQVMDCAAHTPATPCASRQMTSRMAAALSELADFVTVEWPEKQLLILEALDNKGVHEAGSLYKLGRAVTVGLTAHSDSPVSSPTPLDLDFLALTRLGQLAVCAGMDAVQQVANESKLQLAVREDGWSLEDRDLEERRTMFWEGMDNMDVSSLSPLCASAPHMTVGSQWPQQASGPEEVCGPVERPLYRGDRNHMKTLVQWNLTSVTFDPEGQSTKWCGTPARQCQDTCDAKSDDHEPWSLCRTRMMTPRLAIRLRKLQKLAEAKNIQLHVLQAFTEPSEDDAQPDSTLFQEGRGIRLAANPASNTADLASLAVCAGFDYVSYPNTSYIEAFVKAQTGYQTLIVSFIEGPPRAAVYPVGVDDSEYTYPDDLTEESVLPVLVDGGFPPETQISEHVRLRDVMSSDKRYFRLDASLLECIELAQEDFTGTIEILPDSVYRSRSTNFLRNFDLRHVQEKWRFQAGQAMLLRPQGKVTPETLLALATSVLRECPALVRLQMRAVGLGCHSDHIYVDLRPLIPGHERVYVMVWDADRTSYCNDVMRLQKNMVEGGPVVQSTPSISCRDRGLDPGLEFLSFQFGQPSHCNVEGQDEFCRASKEAREKAADTLQQLLTSAAGHGRLPRFELIHEIRACLVDICGGCAGVGPVFDNKVRACARLVHKYIERAASPFPDLSNVTTFFNTDTELSTVQALACKDGYVCVEDTPVYSLLVPTVTARYYPNPKKSLERALFSADINPTPLLELVAQEMAFRAKGVVKVFIEAEKDTYALRNVLKVLFAYNKDVSIIIFEVAPGIDTDLVTSSIQRKLEAWSGVACPHFSRFAMTPFTVVTMEKERHRRSAEDSIPRNKVKSRIYNWEREWLDKMF